MAKVKAPYRSYKDLATGQRIYRWAPGKGLRDQGFKSCSLYNEDGSPMNEFESAAECQRLTDLAREAVAADRAAEEVRRRATPVVTANDLFDAFVAACENNETRGRGGKPLAPSTIANYRNDLKPIRAEFGGESARNMDAEAITDWFYGAMDRHGHAQAHASYRALRAALNWGARRKALRAHTPDERAYSKLNLPSAPARARCGTPQEIDALWRAFTDPAGIAAELGIHKDDAPAADPIAAAAFVCQIWTVQRVGDVLTFPNRAMENGRLMWRQRKTGRVVDLPLIGPAVAAHAAAMAFKRDRQIFSDHVFVQANGAPYAYTTRKTERLITKPFNKKFVAARKLAGRLVPSLTGAGTYPWGDPIPAYEARDNRDTGVTRLFKSGCSVVEVSSWHGSAPEDLMKLMKNYVEIDRDFADAAGQRIIEEANRMGITI